MDIKKLENLNYNFIKIKNCLFLLASLLLFSCNHKTELQQEFNCKEKFITNLEVVTDVKNLFSIEIPKDWKTNLYTDEIQSSIFTADTTKQLTRSILLDVNFVKKRIEFNDLFKLKIEQENLSNRLIQKQKKEVLFLNKAGYYVLSFGKKNNFKYQSLQLFLQVNKENSIIAKAEIYGDSLVDKRICKAITLLEKIKLLQND